MDRLKKKLYVHNKEHGRFLIRFDKSKKMDYVQNNNHNYRNI